MTTMTNEGNVPQWDVSDRLSKALKHSGVGTAVMAEYLGISRNTVGNYTSGRTVPDRRTLMLWAMRTGVPLEWLETGEDPADPQGPDGGVPVTSRYVVPQTPRLRALSAA